MFKGYVMISPFSPSPIMGNIPIMGEGEKGDIITYPLNIKRMIMRYYEQNMVTWMK
jgi:hypothetical protein